MDKKNSELSSHIGLAGLNATVVSLGLSVLFNAAAATTVVMSAPIAILVVAVTAACAFTAGVNLRDAFRVWRDIRRTRAPAPRSDVRQTASSTGSPR